MKILMVNIDHAHKSVYTGLVASALRMKIPHAKITALLSTPNDFLETNPDLEAVHFLDTQTFFDRTKDLSDEKIEEEMVRALGPLGDTEWNVVINLSSNLLGSIFCRFLNAKESKGALLDPGLERLNQSDLFSFILTDLSERYGAYLHFLFLYRNMLRRFEDVTLTSHWGQGIGEEFKAYFTDLKKKEGKEKLVLIDTTSLPLRSKEMELMLTLVKSLKEDPTTFPVLLGHGLDDGHPLIIFLKERLSGTITALSFQNKASLSVIGLGSLLITGDVYHKSIADVAGVPSVYLSKKLDLENFSTVPGSVMLCEDWRDISSSLMLDLIEKVLHSGAIAISDSQEIFETIIDNNLPLLAPVIDSRTDSYANWILGVRFFSQLLKLQISLPQVDPLVYSRAILAQERLLESRTSEGIFGMAKEIALAKLRNTPLFSPAHAYEVVKLFLKGETQEISSRG